MQRYGVRIEWIAATISAGDYEAALKAAEGIRELMAGDSNPRGLDECPEMYRTEILIAEMTFVSPSHRTELIHKVQKTIRPN